MIRVTEEMEDAGMAVRVDHGRLRLPAHDCRRIYEAMDKAVPVGSFPNAYGIEAERFVAYWFFTGWTQISFGINISLEGPNIELHLPFGFIRVGIPTAIRRYTGTFSEIPTND